LTSWEYIRFSRRLVFHWVIKTFPRNWGTSTWFSIH